MDSFESRMNPRFLAESEKRMLWEPRVIESGRETVEGFQEDEEKELLFCHHSVWADFPSVMFLCCLCMHWVLWWGWSLHWEEWISGAVCHLRKAYRVVSYGIGERRSVQDEENGPQYWALRHTVHELWCWWRRVIDWSGLIPERYEWNQWSAVDWMPKTQFRRGEFGGQ